MVHEQKSSICSQCLEVISGTKHWQCETCQLSQHLKCLDEFLGCKHCANIKSEQKLCLDRAMLNYQLSWAVWHAQKAIDVFDGFSQNLLMKCERHGYQYSEELIIEIKRFYCNAKINERMDEASLEVIKIIHEVAVKEVMDFQLCFHCFMFRHNSKLKDFWFSAVCPNPHILVYAKYRSFPYWPAKVLKYSKNNDSVYCRFFGSHDHALVPIGRCLLLTKDYPGTEPRLKGYIKAKEDLKNHLRELNKCFPERFKFAEPNIRLNPEKLFLFEEPAFCAKQ
ncbi:hypothetical protein B4U79_17716 [Dinothrombium tinctorium]|uniref:PWWP domain-containing protein n=1 Tax=Dinothrombium tinctorium TaxID=1965070 RepID=A0A3S4RK98_9ACAR|nr:hypothetical protein B4U79_17716 [Dinothrombium tinctorium]